VERRSPYPGLQPFFAEDLAFFSGRARDVRLIVASLFASPLTLLYGPSGVGKSSVLQAGVLPQLAERPNVVAVAVRDWAEDPVRTIGEAVAKAAGTEFHGDLGDALEACSGDERRRVMLVLDQFEHALAERAVDEALVESLSAALLRPGLRVSALIAIREDSLAELDRFDGRLPGLFDTVLRLEYLDRASGADAIRRPLEAWEQATGEHAEVEDALVEAVLDAVPAGRDAQGVETAQLQLVMARVWEAERAAGSSTLQLETYERLGGADGIVRSHVRDALDAMAGADRELAALALDRLVTPSGARVAHLTEDLAGYAGSDAATLRPVLERLSTARVLRPVAAAGQAGARFEVYHELLADAVLAWLTDHEADRRAAAASARLRRRLLSVTAVAAFAVVVAALLVVALVAQRRGDEARSRALSATARRVLGAGGDPQLALELALRAADTRPTREAQLALRATLAQSFERAVVRSPAGEVLSVDISRDGHMLLSAESDDRARARDRATGRPLRTIAARGVADAAFCPDEGRLALAGDGGAELVAGRARRRLARVVVDAIACSGDGTRVAIREAERARVFDARTGSAVASLRAPPTGTPSSLALSADGDRLAVAVAGGTLVADLHGSRRRTLVRAHGGEEVTAVALSPDGRRVVTGGADGTVLVRDVSRGSTVIELRGNASFVSSVAYAPDGTLVMSTAGDRTARVWDAATGVELATLRGHEDFVNDGIIARDGRTVATASNDGTLRLWRLPIRAVPDPGSDVANGIVARDGRHAVVATNAGAIEVSDLRSGRRLARFAARGALALAVASTGGQVAVIEGDGRLRVWDPARPASPVEIASAQNAVIALDYAPDGRSIVLATSDGAIRIVDPSGRIRREFRGHGSIVAVKFGPDGRRIAVASLDEGAIDVLDARSGRRARRIGPLVDITAVAFSPDGRRVIVGGSGGATIWDVETGRLLLGLGGHRSAVTSAAFDARGDLIATSSGDGEVRVWDANSGDLLTVLAGRTVSLGGDRFILTTQAGGARVYDCAACGGQQALEESGRRRLIRRFTAAQLSPYLK